MVLAPAPDKLSTLVTVHTGRPANMHALRLEAIRSDAPYYAGLLKAPSDWGDLTKIGGQVFVTRYMTDTIGLEPAGVLGLTEPTTMPIAQFDQTVTLLQSSITLTVNSVQLNLTWQVRAPVADDVTIFVHVLDANGQLIAQADGDPLGGTYPFTQWPQGLVVGDIRQVDVSKAATVRVGLYHRASGERLTAVTGDGVPLADNAATITVQP